MQSMAPPGVYAFKGRFWKPRVALQSFILATEEAAFSYLGSTSQMNRPYLARLSGRLVASVLLGVSITVARRRGFGA